MKNIKNFESWKNNIIDHTLFRSGKAKYNPTVVGNIIKYKTGNIEPYYYATIEKKGNKFICKIYKKDKDGSNIRLRNKLKKELKISHNYVREFLNQKLKRDKEKLKNDDEKINKDSIDMNMNMNNGKNDYIQNKNSKIYPFEYQEKTPIYQTPSITPKQKTIIRRF